VLLNKLIAKYQPSGTLQEFIVSTERRVFMLLVSDVEGPLCLFRRPLAREHGQRLGGRGVLVKQGISQDMLTAVTARKDHGFAESSRYAPMIRLTLVGFVSALKSASRAKGPPVFGGGRLKKSDDAVSTEAVIVSVAIIVFQKLGWRCVVSTDVFKLLVVYTSCGAALHPLCSRSQHSTNLQAHHLTWRIFQDIADMSGKRLTR
jgi:hypothetical protein